MVITMRKIINGKLYDTDTAMMIGSYEYGQSGDLSYTSETLYQKKTGELFLLGAGGPMTGYATEYSDNSRGYGETIISESEFGGDWLKEWVSMHCSADTYIQLFGPVAE